ncbi:MAG: hypothetical protein K6F84_01300 [Lachnospiraceae bacterium]|nr:hypothetical protein [Lachnospiraceae bacterium]
MKRLKRVVVTVVLMSVLMMLSGCGKKIKATDIEGVWSGVMEVSCEMMNLDEDTMGLCNALGVEIKPQKANCTFEFREGNYKLTIQCDAQEVYQQIGDALSTEEGLRKYLKYTEDISDEEIDELLENHGEEFLQSLKEVFAENSEDMSYTTGTDGTYELTKNGINLSTDGEFVYDFDKKTLTGDYKEEGYDYSLVLTKEAE